MIDHFGVQCEKCGAIIYSRCRHDFRWCPCLCTAIDGGFDYVKASGGTLTSIPLRLDVTKAQLFDDWNEGTNLYGVIPKIDCEIVIGSDCSMSVNGVELPAIALKVITQFSERKISYESIALTVGNMSIKLTNEDWP